MEDTHHLTPLICAVYGPKYLVYPCPHLSQGFIREGMRFIRHVESILADVDEFAWDSTHEGFSIVSVRFHERRKVAVTDLFCTAKSHSLPRRSARHLRAMSGSAHQP